jgi:hypothetical protein
MNAILTTTNTPKYADAVEAASAPCWHKPVTDMRQFGSVRTLAERCVR